MTFLLWTTLTLAAAAVTVTLHALRSAREGFEDETGFHFVVREGHGADETATLISTLRPSHS